MKMRTAFFTNRHQVSLKEIALPEIRSDEALIEIHSTGICGSDLHRYDGINPWGGNVVYPFRAGHEMAGIVTQIGKDIKNISPGQTVAIEPMQLAGCGLCVDCSEGYYNRCQQRATVEDRRVSYGFSDFDVAKESHLHRVPKNIPLEIAALTDVYACAFHAVNKTNIAAGQSVAIIGTGPVALALGQIARQRGIRVILVGRRSVMLNLAQQVQAADVLVTTNALDVKSLIDIKRSGKIDTVFEVVGGRNSQTIDMAMELVSPGGTIAIIGAFENSIEVSYQKANRKEIALRWCNGYAMHEGKREFAMALDWLVKNKELAGQIVTHRLDFRDIQQAFDLALNKSTSNAVKIMLFPKRQQM